MSLWFTLAAVLLAVVGCQAANVNRDHPKVAQMLREIERLRGVAARDGHLTQAAYYVTMAPTFTSGNITFSGGESGDDVRPDHSYEIECSRATIRKVKVATVVEVLLADAPSASRSVMKRYVWYQQRWIEAAELFTTLYPEQARQLEGAMDNLLRTFKVTPKTTQPTTRPASPGR